MLKAVKFLAGAFLMMVGLASAQQAQAVEWKEHVMGDENAPVTMIEYASLTCPHCASFHNEVLPEIKEKLIDTGKLKLIYRDYPLDGVALRAAAIAQCAGEDRYFGVLGMLFKSQMTWARSQDPVASIKEVVRFAGMTGDAVDACIADQELIDGIVGSRMTGEQEFNVSSTPSFILDGELIEGSREAELFVEKVEDLID
ncbi:MULTISPECIES: DsbA family protein [Thalassospira]|uniref:DSBA oxidoreductase n=1 Tax=Thalassospira profundimaris TaxID=502049 RepID=A0A367VDC6_9PROT|nr:MULTISPECIES: DsbA family protein [Thalassospira]KZB72017.1 disulfide bond formation protein DsbA [Thalassospira sp. MCCC 1A01148]MBR9901303.1 DsbA family protein [Rhodospirillales bacterium]RCK22220.1 DSBA oxidoreductase [Thalassospira profundimaris]